jgi:hypothetical protein
MLSRKELVDNIMTGRRCIMREEDYEKYRKEYGKELFREFYEGYEDMEAHSCYPWNDIYLSVTATCLDTPDCCDDWDDWDVELSVRWGHPDEGEEDPTDNWITPKETFIKEFWENSAPYEFDYTEEGGILQIKDYKCFESVAYRLPQDMIEYITLMSS